MDIEIEEEELQSLISVFCEKVKRDPTTVLKFFCYRDGRLGFNLTNSAMKLQQQQGKTNQQHQVTAPVTNRQQQQQQTKAPQTIGRGGKKTVTTPSSIFPYATRSKRRRVETTSPTNTSPQSTPKPVANTPATPTTPEVARETTTITEQLQNVSALTADERDTHSDQDQQNEEPSVSDHPDDLDNAKEVTQSDFFHVNRFDCLSDNSDTSSTSDQCDSDSDTELEYTNVNLEVCTNCNKFFGKNLQNCANCRAEWKTWTPGHI